MDVRPDWSVLEQIPLPSLTKLSYEVKTPPTDEVSAGSVEHYNKDMDRITPKTEKPLQRFVKRVFRNVTASEDPILKRLAAEKKGTVFSTDSVLSTLMCAPRSVYGWDIVITKSGNTVRALAAPALLDSKRLTPMPPCTRPRPLLHHSPSRRR